MTFRPGLMVRRARPLAPHGTLVFAPGGYHLMCMQPKGLKPGDTAPVTLKFRDGSTADARFAIRNAAGN